MVVGACFQSFPRHVVSVFEATTDSKGCTIGIMPLEGAVCSTGSSSCPAGEQRRPRIRFMQGFGCMRQATCQNNQRGSWQGFRMMP